MKRIVVEYFVIISLINCQLILHKTQEDNVLDFDCLYYRISKENQLIKNYQM